MKTALTLSLAVMLASNSEYYDEIRIIKNQIDYLNKQNLSEKIRELEHQIGRIEDKLDLLSHNIEKTTETTKPATEKVDDQTLYHQAITAIKKSNRKAAQESLSKLIEQYPDSKWLASAHYWLGEVYLQQQSLEKAHKQFSIVIEQYPKCPKRADALLKQATIYIDRGQTQQAIKLLENILAEYPESDIASQARSAIKKLKIRTIT